MTVNEGKSGKISRPLTVLCWLGAIALTATALAYHKGAHAAGTLAGQNTPDQIRVQGHDHFQ